MQKMFFSRQEQNNGAFALQSSEVVGETSSGEDVSAIINYYILRETISNMQLRLIGQC